MLACSRRRTTIFKSTRLLLTFGAVALAPTASAPPPDIREWTVPWEGSRPRDPFVDPKGRVWFVGQQGNYVAYLDPVTGRFERYKVVDPSFHNWIGLAYALRGQQISDFPLCNKSFNLSYCGHDL